jgi:hypothetical protein
MSRRSYALALGLGGVLALPAVWAQPPAASYNEILAKTKGNVQDIGDVWVLNFRFTPPRLITVDVPGRGRRLCWYMLYAVSNPDTREPHRFVPKFELLKLDPPRTTYVDQVLPTVQRAVQQVEDPAGVLDIKNSVTIESQPLPPAKPDAVPRWVTGVATWDEVDPSINRFSVLVSGLSNGWSVDDKDVIRRKTLQLNFQRLGDRANQDGRDIKFIRPEAWEYVATTLKAPEAKPAAKPEAKPDKQADAPARAVIPRAPGAPKNPLR